MKKYLVVITLMSLLLSGCSKRNEYIFSELYDGMPRDEVISILGDDYVNCGEGINIKYENSSFNNYIGTLWVIFDQKGDQKLDYVRWEYYFEEPLQSFSYHEKTFEDFVSYISKYEGEPQPVDWNELREWRGTGHSSKLEFNLRIYEWTVSSIYYTYDPY